MYTKWGALFEAHEVFEKLPCRDIVSWNALIAGYAQLDKANRVFISLRQLRLEGTMPNAASFLLLLNVCSHASLLEGQVFFDDMCKVHCVNLK